MARKIRSTQEIRDEARRHVAAIRAFHTGLVADCHEHLHVLAAITQHVDVMRQEPRSPADKLASAHACCEALTKLRRMRQPWRDTYDDLKRSVVRARTLFRHLARAPSPARRRA